MSIGDIFPGSVVRLRTFKNYFGDDTSEWIEHKMNVNHKKTVGIFVFIGYDELGEYPDKDKLDTMLARANLKRIE